MFLSHIHLITELLSGHKLSFEFKVFLKDIWPQF